MFVFQNKALIFEQMKMLTSLPISHVLILMLLNTCMVKAKPNAKGKGIEIKRSVITNMIGNPDHWDWQNEPSNYPVF